MKELCVAAFLFIVFSIVFVAAIAWTHHPEGVYTLAERREETRT